MTAQEHWQAGLDLLQEGDGQKATEHFVQACVLDPQIVDTIDDTQSPTSAIALLETALTSSGGNFGVREYLVEKLMQILKDRTGQDVLRAGERLKSLLPKSDPRRASVYLFQGHAEKCMGQVEQAINSYKTASKKGDVEAEECWRRLILDTNSPSLYNSLCGTELTYLIITDLRTLAPVQLSGAPSELSQKEIQELLLGEFDVLEPSKDGYLLRIWTEPGGGICHTALVHWKPGRVRFESFFKEQYRPARWPERLSPAGWNEWDLKAEILPERLDQGLLNPTRRSADVSTVPEPVISWKRVKAALLTQTRESFADVMDLDDTESLELGRLTAMVGALQHSSERLADLAGCLLHWNGARNAIELGARFGLEKFWVGLRKRIVTLDELDYEQAKQVAARWLAKDDRVKYSLPFCFPDELDWSRTALGQWLDDVSDVWSGWKFLPVLSNLDQLESVLARKNLHYFDTVGLLDMVVVQKGKSLPLLLRLYDACPFPDQRHQCATAIGVLESPISESFFMAKLEDEELGNLARDYLGEKVIERADPGERLQSIVQFPDRCLETSVAEALRKRGRPIECLQSDEQLVFRSEELTLIDELEISELTLKRADSLDEDATPILRSLDGVEFCTNLRRLVVHQSAPLSLCPLASLRRLEKLEIGPPSDDWPTQWQSAWSLVNLESLTELPALQYLKLPVDSSLNLDYPELLEQVQINSELVGARAVELGSFEKDTRTRAADGLGQAVVATYQPIWADQGLQESNIDESIEKIVAATILLTDPAPSSGWASLFPSRASHIQEAEENLRGRPSDPYNKRVLAEWVAEGMGRGFSSSVGECLAQSVESLVNLLNGNSPQSPNWFRRRRDFQTRLKEFAPLDPEPAWNKDKRRLSWHYQGREAAIASVHILGVYRDEKFQAGWTQEVGPITLKEVLGVPSRISCSIHHALELAGLIASKIEETVMVLEMKEEDGSILFFAVEPPKEPD